MNLDIKIKTRRKWFDALNCMASLIQSHFKLPARGLINSKEDGVFLSSKKLMLKKKSVVARLPYVRKYHQYLLYKAFNEEPG